MKEQATKAQFKLLRQIGRRSKTTSYVAMGEDRQKVVLTFIERDRIFERYRMLEHRKGKTLDEGGASAKEYYESYIKACEETVRRVKNLKDDHVAEQYRVVHDQDRDLMAIVSEYHPGINIFHATRGFDTPLQMISLFVQMFEGVRFIHRSDLLHLNIKPSLIQVDVESVPAVVKLMNFGFAVPIDKYDGSPIGTPSYMAPELLMEGKLPVDERADLYSCAVVMYTCLTGKQLFEHRLAAHGDLLKLKTAVERDGVISPPSHHRIEIPKELDEIVLTLLQKSPDRRGFRDADAVINTFTEIWPKESREMPYPESSTLVGTR